MEGVQSVFGGESDFVYRGVHSMYMYSVYCTMYNILVVFLYIYLPTRKIGRTNKYDVTYTVLKSDTLCRREIIV